jgi:hypothetical protein
MDTVRRPPPRFLPVRSLHHPTYFTSISKLNHKGEAQVHLDILTQKSKGNDQTKPVFRLSYIIIYGVLLLGSS